MVFCNHPHSFFENQINLIAQSIGIITDKYGEIVMIFYKITYLILQRVE